MKAEGERIIIETSSVFREQGHVMTAAMPSAVERRIKLSEDNSGAPAQETAGMRRMRTLGFT